MKTLLEQSSDSVRFVVTKVEPNLRPVVADFGFVETTDEFVRSFPPTSLDVEKIFDRFQKSFQTMLRQVEGTDPIPWGEALLAFAHLVGDQADWWVVGSAALAVRGVDVAPHDVDLVVRKSDFERVNELLVDYLVEPSSASDDWVAAFFCRAFIGVRVEWVAGVRAWVDAPSTGDFGPVAASRRESIHWNGFALQVPPIDLQLAVSERRGLTGRVQKIQSFLAGAG